MFAGAKERIEGPQTKNWNKIGNKIFIVHQSKITSNIKSIFIVAKILPWFL